MDLKLIGGKMLSFLHPFRKSNFDNAENLLWSVHFAKGTNGLWCSILPCVETSPGEFMVIYDVQTPSAFNSEMVRDDSLPLFL